MKIVNESKAFVRVLVEADDIRALADKWPCNHLNLDNATEFEFDKRNGDLVDSNDADTQLGADPQAILALCNDAKAFAQLLVKF